MSDTKRYKLLKTAIVTALDASNPTARGTVWAPTEILDKQEADALVMGGIAEGSVDAPTQAPKSAPKSNKLSGIVDATKQEDGTYKNKAGVQVHADGTALLDGDADLLAALSGTNDEVAEHAEGLDEAELIRLGELESIGKNRQGVHNAVEAGIAAFNQE